MQTEILLLLLLLLLGRSKNGNSASRAKSKSLTKAGENDAFLKGTVQVENRNLFYKSLNDRVPVTENCRETIFKLLTIFFVSSVKRTFYYLCLFKRAALIRSAVNR